MSNNCIVILSGLPGAGKTTCVNQLEIEFSFKYNCFVIHYDDFLPPDFDNFSFKEVRNNILNVTNKFLETLINKNDSSFQFITKTFIINRNSIPNLLIIDDNMYYRSMRYEFFKLSRQFQISFCQICIDLELDVILERNKLRSSSEIISDEIIKNMYTKFEKPIENWEKYSLIFNSDIDYTLISNLIDRSLEDPNCKIELKTCKKQEQSMLHLIDLELRKIINREIKKVCGNEKSKYIGKLQTWKTDCFQKIKDKDILIDNVDNLESFVENLFIRYF